MKRQKHVKALFSLHDYMYGIAAGSWLSHDEIKEIAIWLRIIKSPTFDSSQGGPYS